ncbi:MAG: M48 family metalloprotease [Candidatus Gracilibacteria bacterium]|nr:M48 family metalloprotease [Candidatus Gracilibacteria bacterium]
MGTFQIPDIPDDDVQPMKPDLRWMTTMLAIILGICIFTFGLFYCFSYFVISNFSLDQEKKYFGEVDILGKETPFDFSKLSYQVTLPQNIEVLVVESKEINAFASIGGKVLFTTEILKNFKNEEEFLFILGHEIEHIKNRDPLKSYSFHMPIYLTFLVLGMDMGIEVKRIESISRPYMSRQVELASDIGGIGLVKKYGGNTRCILPFFEEPTSLFEKYFMVTSTHPTNQARVEQIIKMGSEDEKNCREWKY